MSRIDHSGWAGSQAICSSMAKPVIASPEDRSSRNCLGGRSCTYARVIGISASNNGHYLATGYGAWYLVELLGFVALPAFLYAVGVRDKNVTLIRWTAAWTVLGIVVNRLNVGLIAFNWHLPSSERYFPHWMEIVISVFLVIVGLLVFRFIVTRMPILYAHPDYENEH